MKINFKVIAMIFFMIALGSCCYATEGSDFWGQGSKWFGNAMYVGSQGIEQVQGVKEVLDDFANMINLLGTTVIICVTIILGIKFMLSGPEGKAACKNGLITLLVACVFFFGWTSLKNLLFPGNQLIFISSADQTIKDPLGRIFGYVKFFGNLVAFIAIIYMGVRYIFSGAMGRADLKGKSLYFIIGLVMTFATINVLSFISDVINETLM